MKSNGPPRNHIPGRDYATAVRGPLLSDSRIAHYIRLGFYGADAQQRLRDNETIKRPTPRPAKPIGALDFLASLLK